MGNVINTEWLEQATLKWGMIGSFCAYQSLNGITDGYHFRQEDTYLINGGNYHAFATAQRTAGIVTGWFGYANFKNTEQSWKGKLRRLGWNLCWGRNCMEWAYKGVRYKNPFDYSSKRNEHAIVYLGIRDGKITDMYIGTGPVSGPLVDVGFVLVGWLLMK